MVSVQPLQIYNRMAISDNLVLESPCREFLRSDEDDISVEKLFRAISFTILLIVTSLQSVVLEMFADVLSQFSKFYDVLRSSAS